MSFGSALIPHFSSSFMEMLKDRSVIKSFSLSKWDLDDKSVLCPSGMM